jgi:hypothetical protein
LPASFKQNFCAVQQKLRKLPRQAVAAGHGRERGLADAGAAVPFLAANPS